MGDKKYRREYEQSGRVGVTATLQDICNLITDGKHGDCRNEEGSGYYFVSCKDVKDGRVDYTAARQITAEDFFDTHKRTQLEPYDVLITNSGTIGRMALVPAIPETDRTTFQKSVAILKPDRSKVNPKWLFYYLRAEKSALISWAGGTAQKNLLLRDLRAFEVQVPPLLTQRKIAAILGAYDDLIENNLRRIKILEEMAQLIYREWFVNFRFPGHEDVPLVDSPLGKIPEGWEVTELGDIAEQVRRNADPGEFDPETPYVGLEHIPRESIALLNWGNTGQVHSTKLAFKKGEILFGKIRPYFHKVVVAPLDGLCSSDTIVINPLDVEMFPLVLGCVSSKEFVSYASQTSQGTKMPRANWDVLVKYPVAVPPRSLYAGYSSLVLDTIKMIENRVFCNMGLRTTRDFLLPKLISGEVDVSDLDIVVGEEEA